VDEVAREDPVILGFPDVPKHVIETGESALAGVPSDSSGVVQSSQKELR
jgi:hypothetical protein